MEIKERNCFDWKLFNNFNFINNNFIYFKLSKSLSTPGNGKKSRQEWKLQKSLARRPKSFVSFPANVAILKWSSMDFLTSATKGTMRKFIGGARKNVPRDAWLEPSQILGVTNAQSQILSTITSQNSLNEKSFNKNFKALLNFWTFFELNFKLFLRIFVNFLLFSRRKWEGSFLGCDAACGGSQSDLYFYNRPTRCTKNSLRRFQLHLR